MQILITPDWASSMFKDTEIAYLKVIDIPMSCLFQLNNLSDLIASLIACELAVASSSNWRLHVELLEKFACFPKCLTSDQIYYKFVPLLFRLLSSNVSTTL